MYGRNELMYYNYGTRTYEVNWERAEQLLKPPPGDAEIHFGPFSATSGKKLAKTWWGQEWLDACELEFLDYDINRARKIARHGLTLLVRFAPGEVAGIVNENKHYIYRPSAVKLKLPVFTPEEWQRVDRIVTSRARYMAELVAGQFSYELMDRLVEVGIDPFDIPDFLADYAGGYHAKSHGLAMAYVVAAMLDKNPLLLFQIHGRSYRELLEAWLNESPPEDEADEVPVNDPAGYWMGQPLPGEGGPLEPASPSNLYGLPAKFRGRIPEICAKASVFAAEQWEQMQPIVSQDTQPVFRLTDASQTPLKRAMQKRYDSITALTDPYCERELDEEFAALARKLTHTLAAQHKSLIDRGHAKTWACAILYALAETNDLFRDNATGYRISSRELCEAFTMSLNTTSNRSRKIREKLNIMFHDPRWTHSRHLVDDPTSYLVRHHGLLVDHRQLVLSDDAV